MPLNRKAHVSGFRILMDDNAHYMDDSFRVERGSYATADEAIAAREGVADRCLADLMEPGMDAAALNSAYVVYGGDPFIVMQGDQPGGVPFSAWDYARARSMILTG
jgi:hypothetical protein